jgi:hypothetical protein
MALFLLCPNLGWIQGQFNFTELSLRYLIEQCMESPDLTQRDNSILTISYPIEPLHTLHFVIR